MPEQPDYPQVDLKDPIIAGCLAWLIPGLGHFYQQRYAKAVLFAVCILGTFLYGLYLGSNPEAGPGRVVYLSFRDKDWRLPFLCQAGVGLPTVPAWVQAVRFYVGHKPPLWGGFMAPPRIDANEPGNQTLHDVNVNMPRLFELGTVYTMIAGLLNILAIYDACCGPVVVESAKKDEEEPDSEQPADGSEKTP